MTVVRTPNTFTDPSGVKPTYHWPVNHSEEDPVQNSRQMTNGAATDDIGLIPQQGAPLPLVFTWKGTLFKQVDFDAMESWYKLCESHSIYLTDPTGSQYEVLISDWNPQREGVAWNPRGQLNYLWRYTIVFRVLRVISGDFS